MKPNGFVSDVQKGKLVFDSDECPKGFTVAVAPFEKSMDFIEAKLEGEVGDAWTRCKGLVAKLIVGQETLPVFISDTTGFPNVKLKKIHPRNHVRVDAYLPVLIKKLSPENLPRLKEMYLKPRWYLGSNSIANDLFNKNNNEIEAEFPKLYQILAEINVKLNIILSFLGCDESKELFLSEPRKINISGSGMAFWEDQCYQQGDYIGVQMVLPLFPMAFIGFIANVVSVSRSNNTKHDEGGYRVSMKFYEISDDSKEKIIQYVFQRQREALRQRVE